MMLTAFISVIQQASKTTCLLLVACVWGCTPNNVAQNSFQAGTATNEFGLVLSHANDTGNVNLSQIRLPQGFKIEAYALNVENARSMCLAPNGVLFVGTRGAGNVYALVDSDNDKKADTKFVLASGLRSPNGVAFKDGDLYVAEISQILKFPDILNNLTNPTYEVIYDDYPTDAHHGWKYIAFGPDGLLYVPVGAPCNICEPEDEIYASITKLDVNNPEPIIVQKGIRNTVGFTWHPQTEELWFTDNGRDWLGDDLPACELNHAPTENLHFGFPYCHQGDMLDDEYGTGKDCTNYTPPAQKLGPHVAPLGLEFYTGDMFPSQFKNQPFIAEHGSWNRSTPIGYRITVVKLNEQGESMGYHLFADGWLQSNGNPWGRPVDVEFMPDGSMLVSDDFANAIYRIWYEQ